MGRAIGQLVCLSFVIFLTPLGAAADVTLPAVFSEGMVLQQGTARIWGRSSEGEKITVKIQGREVSTVARGGKWLLRLRGLKAGGPWRLEVRGRNTIVIERVLVGEVWLCGGQSNMAAIVSESREGAREIASANNPMIRLLKAPRIEADSPDIFPGETGRFRFVSRVQREAPDERVTTVWEECEPATVPRFSAACYFFGRELQKARKVPVGLIDASVGATPIEAWMSEQALAADSDGDREQVRQPWRPAGLYNGMIAPFEPYAIKGVVWWQGEANVNRADQYQALFPALIRGWRQAWGLGAFPFIFVQLATAGPAVPKTEGGLVWGRPALAWAELREAQRRTLSRVPGTAMVVITDIGGENYHPDWKQPVGFRLALAARKIAYRERLVYSGPLYAGLKIEGEAVKLTFQHAGGGLVVRGSELRGFAVAGKDRIFHAARAEIRANQVILTSPSVRRPVAASYGWAAHPIGNLFNREGLPASPFRTDSWYTTQTRPLAPR